MYESHLGGIYFDDEILDFDDLYCEECGDSDQYLGNVETWEDVLDLLTDGDGSCRYAEEYLAEVKGRFAAETDDLYGEE